MSVSLGASRRVRSSFTLLLAGVLWGTGGLSGSLLGSRGGLHPISVAAYRLLLGGAAVVLFVWLSGGLRRMIWTKPVMCRIVAAGGLLGSFQAAYFAAVGLTSVGTATMVTIGSVPVFVTAATAVRTRRMPSRVTLVSVVLAVAGLVLLSAAPGGGGGQLFGGVAFALAAGAGFATLTLMMRRPVEGLDYQRTTAFGLLTGGVVLLPAGLVLGMALPPRLDVLAVALYFGVVPTGLGYAAYFRVLRVTHPVIAALATLLEPLTAALLSAVLFHEGLGVQGWCGAALLAAGLLVGYSRT
ncbi:DME family drug/metabolite transporter [Amycolatopsis endophytica]|uniref:DME family drug/metabolite transporter n=1 Tax=Amycolatopsis endophytica TaxID=860233 RepID=A0A853B786_9PSEU|nr:EamA family transporter [Amycolatopsis endophytica]NYI90376.1 DME family drug/metabolite transporter [Amycolatopsis endophytica]